MRIVDHKVEGAPFLLSPNTSGSLSKPTLLVMHYTASGRSAEADQKHFASRGAQASAHVIVARDGKIYQSVPFNVVAWHAGKSIWRGHQVRGSCNSFSIGIEVDNWGVLQKRGDGKFYSWTGEVVPDNEVLHAKNKLGNDGYWQTYTEEQLRALDELTEAILKAYPTITEVVGHEDIAPRRKTDPGPAFPLTRYSNLVGGRGDQSDQPQHRKVIASSLNVRTGAGTNYELIGSIPEGTEVEVLYDAGEWSQVRTPYGAVGWVYDQYLR